MNITHNPMADPDIKVINGGRGPGRGGVRPGILSGGVLPGSPNPDPISD